MPSAVSLPQQNGIALLATLLVCGCAATPPDVRFIAQYGPPPEGIPAHTGKAVVTTDTAPQLIARGFVNLGRLQATAKHDATSTLLTEASRLGAEVVFLHEDNRAEVVSREHCAEVKKPGDPSFCRQWNTDTGVCNHWSAPSYLECNKWESTREKTQMIQSRASLWRQESLAVAIIKGQAAVRAALAAGENPDAGWLPLIYAIDRPDTEALQALLAGGAQADVRALGYAAMTGNTAAVELLLDAKASVNQGYIHPAGINTTALHEAVHRGNPHIVELLIARGADVNAIPWFGSPALNEAVASGNVQAIRILMAHGANPRLKGSNGINAMDEAAKIPDPGRQRILQVLAIGNQP